MKENRHQMEAQSRKGTLSRQCCFLGGMADLYGRPLYIEVMGILKKDS